MLSQNTVDSFKVTVSVRALFVGGDFRQIIKDKYSTEMELQSRLMPFLIRPHVWNVLCTAKCSQIIGNTNPTNRNITNTRRRISYRKQKLDYFMISESNSFVVKIFSSKNSTQLPILQAVQLKKDVTRPTLRTLQHILLIFISEARDKGAMLSCP